MIDQLDTVLRGLFRNRIPELASDLQVRFEPPNADFRGYVGDLSVAGDPVLALNAYLVDLRENRRLRTIDARRSIDHGVAVDDPAPVRVDCHYVVSAWDSAQANEQVEPTPAEHALLYDALAVLIDSAPLNPSRILTTGLGAIDELIREVDLPTLIVPPDGFGKLSDFWGTMGLETPWRPVIYLVVTLPVALRRRIAGPMVTTTLSVHRPGDEELVNLGGQVLAAGDPVPGAAVRLLAEPGGVRVQATAADEDGRFRFTGLRAGAYRLRAGAQGVGSDDRTIDVPSTTGEYDLHLA